MSRPTIAGLTEKLEAQEAKTRRAENILENIDDEARAYSTCVNALSRLTASGSYASSGKHPDRDAIGRVLDALKDRFDIEDQDTYVENTFEMTGDLHDDEDVRDQFISMLVEALRKS